MNNKKFIIGGIVLVIAIVFAVFHFSNISLLDLAPKTNLPLIAAASYNPSDTRLIGYEFLNTTGDVVGQSEGTIVHIWNNQDDYFFDRDSGIQLTNHFQEYWSKNEWCVYADLGQWNKYCADDFTWTWNEDTDGTSYVNITGTTSISQGAYNADITLVYSLDLNSTSIEITPTILNTKKDFDGYFIWRVSDIQIDMTQENDTIAFDDYEYNLSDDLNLSYTNMTYQHFYLWDGHEYLRLDWEENDYELRVQNESGQYNSPVELWLGEFNIPKDTSYSTTFNWIDKPTAFDFEINVYWFDNGTIACDGGVNSDGFNENTANYVFDTPCELVMGENYTIETLLTSNDVGDSWNLDYDGYGDHPNDGITAWDSGYTGIIGDGNDGTFCGLTAITLIECDTDKELVGTVDKITDEQDGNHYYSKSDVFLVGDSGSHEWGVLTDDTIEFSESSGTSSYGLEDAGVTGADDEQDGGNPLNITFVAYPDTDWTDGDVQYLQYFIDAEGGDPETGFMRWNWTIVTGGEPPTNTCTYGGSGDWYIDCSDYCNVTSNVDLGGNNIDIDGAGELNLVANITNIGSAIKHGTSCQVNAYPGGGLWI